MADLNPHAVIVADAPAADLTIYRALLAEAGLLIAADGGARYVLAQELLPHVVIGDLDSLAQPLIEHLTSAGVEIIRYPAAKDETDLELALLLAVARGAGKISVLAALGGRPDMHLANHLLLALPILQGRDVALLDGDWTIRLIRDSLIIHGRPGARVSLVPLGDVRGVTTQGLRYPLSNEPLPIGPARAVSNEFEADQALVTVASGRVLIFQER